MTCANSINVHIFEYWPNFIFKYEMTYLNTLSKNQAYTRVYWNFTNILFKFFIL